MSFFSLLETSPAALVTTAVVAGLLVGSFINVVIHRLPKILERQWRAEYADLAGTAPPPAERYNLIAPRSANAGQPGWMQLTYGSCSQTSRMPFASRRSKAR